MPEKHLFEYAVIRVVPRVEREEFLNAGVILYCAKQRFLQALFHVDAVRLTACCTELDLSAVEKNLHSLQRICIGGKDSGPIGRLDIAARFRWLTAMRSTVVQTSRVHPGFCEDAGQMLERLQIQLVL